MSTTHQPAARPQDRVQRNEDGLLETVCCQATIKMRNGIEVGASCQECGEAVAYNLDGCLELLALR